MMAAGLQVDIEVGAGRVCRAAEQCVALSVEAAVKFVIAGGDDFAVFYDHAADHGVG